MSRALKDFVIACVLTLAGLAAGLLLAGADAQAAPVGGPTAVDRPEPGPYITAPSCQGTNSFWP